MVLPTGSSVLESYARLLYLLKISWGFLFLFFACFFMSLIVLEWMIGVLCRKSAETEVNNIHSWKWVALLLVWGCIRAEGGLSLLLPWLSSVHQRPHIPVEWAPAILSWCAKGFAQCSCLPLIFQCPCMPLPQKWSFSMLSPLPQHHVTVACYLS